MTRGSILAVFGGAILGLGLLGGCSGKGASAETAEETAKLAKEKAEKAAKEKAEKLNVATTAGNADRRDPVKNEKLYSIAWNSAALVLGRNGLQEGKMNGVSGTVYEAEKAKSTFTAEIGYAKKDSQTLFLEKNVVVKSPEYSATLRAQKLEWLPDVKRYRATGNVTLSSPTGTSGPIPELLASADLRRFGTPKLFDKR